MSVSDARDAAPARGGLLGKFATVGGATMASRVLGFAREAMIGAALGAGPVADAFYTALALPNLFRRIFAEGAFNAAFVPLFAKELEAGGMAAARRFAVEVLSILVPVLAVLSAVCIVAMPAIVFLNAPGFADDAGKFDLTVTMARIMFPYLFALSLVAMLSGVLNSLRRYFLAAIVPVLLNVILVGTVATALWLGIDDVTTGVWLAWGVFAAGFAQLLLLVWGTRAQAFRIAPARPRLTPGVRHMLRLMGPAVLTGGVIQINLFVGQVIASMQDGARALLNYADRLNQLPLGVIGIAIGVVLLPELARALKANEHRTAQTLQNRSLEFALALTLPAAVAFVVVPEPLVALLYQRGEFTVETTVLTALALAAYATGLPAYVLIKVFQPAFFARLDTQTPFRFSVVMVVVNVAGSLALFPLLSPMGLGHVGIALATSVSAWVNVALLASVAWRRGDFRPDPATLRRIVVILASAILMGLALAGVEWVMPLWLFEPDLASKLLRVGALAATGAIVFFGLCLAFGGIDRSMLRAVRRS